MDGDETNHRVDFLSGLRNNTWTVSVTHFRARNSLWESELTRRADPIGVGGIRTNDAVASQLTDLTFHPTDRLVDLVEAIHRLDRWSVNMTLYRYRLQSFPHDCKML